MLSVKGSVIAPRTSGIFKSLPLPSVVFWEPTICVVKDSRYPAPNTFFVTSSRMRKTRTEDQLKQSWTVAAEKARSNSFASATWVNATNVLVMLVPMLAPITIGMAVAIFNPKYSQSYNAVCYIKEFFAYFCSLRPDETIDTITEVQVDELCTKTVNMIPIMRPTTGFLMMSDSNIFPGISFYCQNNW